MSTAGGAPEYQSPQQLVNILKENPSSVAVVDVRESDYTLGKVKGSLHIPFCQFESYLPHLLDLLKHRSPSPAQVIFHCHYSQTRGPAAAQLFSKFLMDRACGGFEVFVLEGGFKMFKAQFQHDTSVYQPL